MRVTLSIYPESRLAATDGPDMLKQILRVEQVECLEGELLLVKLQNASLEGLHGKVGVSPQSQAYSCGDQAWLLWSVKLSWNSCAEGV